MTNNFPKQFQFNKNLKYEIPAIRFNKQINYINEVKNALTNLDIYVSETNSFNIKMENININIIIQARMGSSRLPNKIMKQLGNKKSFLISIFFSHFHLPRQEIHE